MLLRHDAIRRSLLPFLPQWQDSARLRLETSPDGGITAFAQLTTGEATPMWAPTTIESSGPVTGTPQWRVRGIAHTDRPWWIDQDFSVPSTECVVLLRATAMPRDPDTYLYTFTSSPVVIVRPLSEFPRFPDVMTSADLGQEVTILAPLVTFANGIPSEQISTRAISLTVALSGTIGDASIF